MRVVVAGANQVTEAVLVGRLFAGEAGVAMLTDVRGASDAKGKRELGWEPAHPSGHEGCAESSFATAVLEGVRA